MLDALESGRVEEVLVKDGAQVSKGELLFRLSNPQLRLELVAREADRAQQISNLSILRVDSSRSQTRASAAHAGSGVRADAGAQAAGAL